MSSPAEIEIAAIPEWLAEDSTASATATVISASATATASSATPDVEDPGGTGWLIDESPASRATAVTGNAIHTPSRTARTTNRTSNTSSDKKKSKSKSNTKKTEQPKEKKKSSKNNKGNRNSDIEANIDTTINVNNGGDNNNVTSAAEAASEKTWGEYFQESFQRDGRLLLITLVIVIVMSIPAIWWILYPFVIFSTWIHEMCHGLAALMIGGNIVKLEVFPDGSGLATWAGSASSMSRRGFVSSAGYQGTAFVGFLLLIFRRTKRGPRTGTMVLACWMLLSCIIWIRNVYGFIFIFCFGLVLGGMAWKLPSFHIRNLYVILAMMTSMNAITAIRYLFGASHNVNGQPVQTDAHAMAEVNGGSYILWATLWLILAIVLTLLGVVFAIPGPDEVADFTCCGVCQDIGCFKLCNYPGQRCLSRFLGRDTASGQENSTATASNTTSEEP